MKNLTAAVWIILLVVLQSASVLCLNISGITIPLIIPFAAALAFLEEGFCYAFVIGIICGVLEGTFFGSQFAVSVFVTAVFVMGILNFRNRPRYVSDLIKLPVWAFFAVFVERLLSAFVKGGSADMMLRLLPNAAVTSAIGASAAAVIYVLLKKTIYKSAYKTFVL